jgi:hypothetical protein
MFLPLLALAASVGCVHAQRIQAAAPLPSAGDARAVVLYFLATDCPISNRTLPEMRRIEQQFSGQRVRFWFVFPNATETPQTLKAHEAAYNLPASSVLTDPRQTLGHLTGAHVTPEAAVLIPSPNGSLRTVYEGRVDDKNLKFGTERPAATRHDLIDALNAVLAGKPVPKPGGPPVGCTFVTSR